MARLAAFKAQTTTTDTGLSEGQFKALVSVFGNTDTYGDVVMPGAFTKSLKTWEDRGAQIPVIWSHDWQDPFSHVGTTVKAVETERGLEIIGEIPPEEQEANPKAAQIYRLLKSGRVSQFSFAYDVVESSWGERDGREVYELKELDLIEVGPCLIGVNQETELLGIKSDAIDRAVAKALKAQQETHEDPSPGSSQETTSPAASGEDTGTSPTEHPDTSRVTDQEPATPEGTDPAISLAEIDLIETEGEGETHHE